MTDGPEVILTRIVQDAQQLTSAKQLKPVGTYASEFLDQIKDDLNGDNVGAFLHGISIMGILLQEAGITAVVLPADNENATSQFNNGAVWAAGTISEAVNNALTILLPAAVEKPIMDQQFKAIVNGL